MITLTVDSLKDYQTCARLYDFRHIENLYEPIGNRELMAERFENTLKRVLSFFFYKKMGGIVPSYAALLSRWERLWFPKDMSSYDIAVEQHESAYGNLASYSNEAAAVLLKFYEDFEKDTYDPILVDEAFTVPVTDEIRLEGAFDLCTRNAKTAKYKLIKWSAKHRKPSTAVMLLDFAAYKYAFEYRNEKARNVEYYTYDLISAKGGFTKIDVNEDDIRALQFWSNEIEQDVIFPSRRDLTYYCKSCPFYDKECAVWSGWDNG
jgi:hypothetical protein